MTRLQKLRITTYNSTGFGKAKCSKVKSISDNSDIVLVQEHWLLKSQLSRITNGIKDFTGTAISGVDATARILPGRPSGGCAVLWRRTLDTVIKPVEYSFMCKRICGITINCNSHVILLLCVYFPTDTGSHLFDETALDMMLSDISSVCDNVNPHGIIIAGDINCDFNRTTGFVNRVKDYIVQNNLFTLWNNFPVDYTYIHTDKESKSTIDHFIVNVVMADVCTAGGVDHQYSDGIFHSPAYIHLDVGNIPMYEQNNDTFVPKVAWYKASQNDIDTYKYNFENALKNLNTPTCITDCTDQCCALIPHKDDISKYYNDVISLMISAGKHLPRTCKPEDSTRVPGWTTHVKPFKEESVFWKRLYDEQNPNASGFVTHMMRSSRNAYHYAIRRVKTNRKLMKKCNFLDTMLQGNRQFMKETKKVKQNKRSVPSSVDGAENPPDIAEHFASKYETLFNSCKYDQLELDSMWDQVNDDIMSSDKNELYTTDDIREAIKCLKTGKQDGVHDLMTENFINAPVSFNETMCAFYNVCLTHGYVPKKMLISTLVPIPKDMSKSDIVSDNYRAIALSALFMKIFEYCVLNQNRDKLLVSGLQFAYKPEHSTTQCTWAAKEVVSYYNNNGSNVHACVLDCSKAFDKIRHDILFKKLYDKGLPPILVRIIMQMYLNSSAQVKWDGSISTTFNMSNGVKQGSVISPLFFTLYVDELVQTLEKSGYGCKLGAKYFGILVYADDIFLLSPSFYSLQKMLDICNLFAEDRGLQFNAKKTKCITFHIKHSDNDENQCVMVLNNDNVKWYTDITHLGHHFNCCLSFKKDTNFRKGQFIQCVNEICTEFGFAHPKCKSKLLQIYGSSFYGSNLWDLYSKEFVSLCKTWNVAIRKIYGLPFQTHCRFLTHICQQSHVNHIIKCRFMNFMLGNYMSENDFISFIAKVCFKNVSTNSGGTVSKIMCEYNVDFINLDNPQTIKHQMALWNEKRSFEEIQEEEWKINMIMDIVDCIHGISESNLSEEENLFLLNDVCTF